MTQTEYLRRNSVLADACSARFNARLLLERMQGSKNRDFGEVDLLRGVVDRLASVVAELTSHRDEEIRT